MKKEKNRKKEKKERKEKSLSDAGFLARALSTIAYFSAKP